MMHVRTNRLAVVVAGVAVAALALGACNGDNNNGGSSSGSGSGGSGAAAKPTPPKTSTGASATVGTANGSLGAYLVDSQGRSIYLFQIDQGTKSACTGQCATFWPPVRVSGKPTAGTGLTASKLGTTPRTDGQPQVTYNGHPLYLYAADKNVGDTTGQGLSAFGGPWYLMTPAGDAITTMPSGASGGGVNGY